MFDDGRETERRVAEDAAVGDPVTATDGQGDRVVYSLEGPAAGSFSIDGESGQISVVAALDHAAKARHAVTVRASDGEAEATIPVTVVVTRVHTAPTFDADAGVARRVGHGAHPCRPAHRRGAGDDRLPHAALGPGGEGPPRQRR